MCGLAGFIRLSNERDPPAGVMDTFTNLFMTSQLRGFHSSGVAIQWKQKPKKKKRATLTGWVSHKALLSPFDILRRATYEMEKKGETRDATHDDIYPIAMLGHSRHATMGSVTAKNAHPFAFFNNRFIGTHNGTIHNADRVYRELVRDVAPLEGTKPASKDYGAKDCPASDSETVFYCIYRWGIDKVYPLIEGAWALVWYDQETGEINFVRNHARNLFFYWTPRWDSVFWSSEQMMIEFACRREMEEYEKEQCRMFTPHVLYTIDTTKSRMIPYQAKHFTWSKERSLNHHRYTPVVNKYKYPGASHLVDAPFTEEEIEKADAYWLKRQAERRRARSDTALPDVIHVGEKPGALFPRRGTNTVPNKFLQHSVEFTVDVKPTVQDRPSEEETNCLWCHKEIEHDDVTVIVPEEDRDGGGEVCSHCASNQSDVEGLIEMYPQLINNTEWQLIWWSLTDKKEA